MHQKTKELNQNQRHSGVASNINCLVSNKKKKREKYNDEGRIYLNSPQQLSKISGQLSFIYIAFIVK